MQKINPPTRRMFIPASPRAYDGQKMRFAGLLNLLAASAFFVLFASAAILAKVEISIATEAPKWDSEHILQQSIGPSLGFSHAADYAVTDACLQTTQSVETLFLPSKARLQLVQACQNLILGIVETSAQNAYAWFALAYFAQEQSQTGEVNRTLLRSYDTGPYEQWIAEQRVPVAEAALPALSDAAKAGHLQDLAMLVQSHRGIRAIAQRYVQNEGFRDRITNVVEKLSTDDQKRFLRILQHEVRRN